MAACYEHYAPGSRPGSGLRVPSQARPGSTARNDAGTWTLEYSQSDSADKLPISDYSHRRPDMSLRREKARGVPTKASKSDLAQELRIGHF
jgi:hypothetical protein